MTIDRVSPAVRRKLVNVRQEAMRSGSASVLPSIVAYARESPLTPDERCHLEMAAAELAYLDGDLDAALGFMSREATLAAIPRELRITVSDNRLMTQVLRPQSFDRNESRRNWDEKELRSSDQDFNAELVEALRAARTGKHFDALPQLRSYLVHAYWSGDWRLFRDAASELSREQLALGEVAHSAYCAMLACNEEAIVAAATTSATTGTPDSVRAALALLLEYGHLRQHARVVCAFLEAVADAVPDDLVDTAAEYLLTWTHFKREFMSPLNVGTAAWEALEALGARVSPAVAERALDAALNADAWREPRGLEREVLVKACAELVLRCSDARAESFALQAVTLAKPEHRSHDYQSVLRLLWRTSTRSQQAKDAVIAELFPSAVSAPASLLQLGKLLGRKLSSRDELNALATRFADRIRKQVTLMVPGEPVPPAEGFGHFSFVDGEHQVVVELSHCAPSFEGLLGYAEELSGEAVKLLITALIEMIASPFNLLANKSELVHYIGRFADRIEAADIQPVIDLLEPLAPSLPR